MNMKFLYLGIILIVFAVIQATGCVPSKINESTHNEEHNPGTDNNQEDQFADLIGVSNINTSIRLSTPEEFNNFPIRIGDSIDVLIENLTEYEFQFDFSVGPTLFTYLNHQWIEVENLDNYVGDTVIIEPYGLSVTSATPIIVETYKPSSIRVLIVGDLRKIGMETKETVAGFIDVEVLPRDKK